MRRDILLLLSVFLWSSCLDQSPSTSFKEEHLYTTEAGLRAALDGCYGQFIDHTYRGGGQGIHMIAVNSTVLANTTVEQTRMGQKISRQTSKIIANPTYVAPYRVISSCNMILDRIERASIDEKVRSEIKGETSLLRAIAYFDIVRSVGRCPLPLRPIDGDLSKLMMPRSSMKEVYGVILSDLRFAEINMPVKGAQRSWHPHRMAATALKAKVFMQMASLTPDHFEACKDRQMEAFYQCFSSLGRDEARRQLWDSCYTNALIVYNSHQYRLVEDYAQLWNNRTKNSVESIIEFQANKNYSPSISITINTLHGGVTKNGSMGSNYGFSPYTPNTSILVSPDRIGVAKATFCEHWTLYGNGKKLVSDKSSEAISSNNEQGCDQRINSSYLYFDNRRAGYENFGILPIFPNAAFLFGKGTFPSVKKYYYDEFRGNSSDCNLIYLRLADVLLILAESANELGHQTSEVIAYVNQLLQRARNGNNVPDKNGDIQPKDWSVNSAWTQDSLRTRILYERQFELLCENGDENFDVRRHGIEIVSEYLQRHNYWVKQLTLPLAQGGWSKKEATIPVYDLPYTITLEMLKQSLFFPIPIEELQVNTSIPYSEQNYGW